MEGNVVRNFEKKKKRKTKQNKTMMMR